MLLACSSHPPTPTATVDWHDRAGIASAFARYDDAHGEVQLGPTYTMQDPSGQSWPIATLSPHWNEQRSAFDLLFPTGPTTAEVMVTAQVYGEGKNALVAYTMSYAPFREGRQKYAGGDFITTDIHLHSIGDTAFYRYVQDGDYFRREPIPAPTP